MSTTPLTEPEIRRVLEEHLTAEARHDADAAAATYAEDGYYQNVPLDIRWRGRQQVAQQYANSFRGVPNSAATVEGEVLQGQRLVQWGTFRGTMTGPWLGQAPTGNAIALPFIAIYEFGNGKMLGETLYFDLATACEQAGITLEAVREAVRVLKQKIHAQDVLQVGAA